MPRITIDNQTTEVEEGVSILEAARRMGIEIPTLCHLPGRPAQASCLLCMVRVRGMSRLVPSCGTMVSDGMEVESETADVLDARRTAIELLLSEHLGDCIGPCRGVCPARMDIPRMIRYISAGQYREALITVKERIALPAVLGRICPELCEKGCRRGQGDGPVAICLLKRFAADRDLESGAPYLPECRPPSGKRVAIVGSGPAGLAAAYYLLQDGHACVVFDEHPAPGGMLRYGVPEELLPRKVLDAEIDLIRTLGAEFRCGIRVESVESLRAEFDAVLLATGDVRERPPEGIEMGRQGIAVSRESMTTSVPGVFAAGSAVIASRHAIRAVADGRSAAESISRSLRSALPSTGVDEPFTSKVGRLEPDQVSRYVERASAEDRIVPTGGAARGFTEEEAVREAKRCLECDCARADDCLLRIYAERLQANQLRFRGDRLEFELDDSHPEVLYEPGKCIACGICVRIAAEAGEELGLAFHGRGFGMRMAPPFRRSLAEGLRKAARACAEACPTAALTLRRPGSRTESP